MAVSDFQGVIIINNNSAHVCARVCVCLWYNSIYIKLYLHTCMSVHMQARIA